MNSRLPPRILYALGCALVLSVYSLTPRSTFAQSSESPASTAEHTGAAARASERGAGADGIPPSGRAASHTGEVAAPSDRVHANDRGASRAANGDGARARDGAAPHTGEVAAPSDRPRTGSVVLASAGARENMANASEHTAGAGGSAPASERTGVVNLNTATDAELERLPRIGPTRAQAILALRAKLTRFSKVEQLLRVKGIGRATFRKLRPMLALEGPTTLPERKAR